jgi:resuscitation-promoting factor RpfA
MMMTRNMLCARASAAAIAAAVALSPIHAAPPKPIVDLSKSPALSGKEDPSGAQEAAKTKPMIGPVDQQTAEFGGGAIALLMLGAGAFAMSRRKKREDGATEQAAAVPQSRDPLFDEPMFQDEPIEESAFAWGTPSHHGETWVERAERGPTPDNPSLSLRARLKRAAFFDKREREAAAGKAAPVETDAGLPESMAEERRLEAA